MSAHPHTVIFGAGNLLLSDEGLGVHFIRHLAEEYEFPDSVELVDAGTLGIMAAHRLEGVDRAYIIDALAVEGEPGLCIHYGKAELLRNGAPLKLSPHQIGLQEMLLLSELRGCCPRELFLLGIIPENLEPGACLSSVVEARLARLAVELVAELGALGVSVRARPTL